MPKSARIFDDSIIDAELAIVGHDVDEGRLNDARERLRALCFFASDRNCLEFGQLFLRVGIPEMAGRFWYFEENPTAEMTDAIRAFEKSCGNSPILIGNSLRLFPHRRMENDVLERLRADERNLIDRYDYNFAPRSHWATDRLILVGCSIVGFVVLFVLMMGGIFIQGLMSGKYQ